MKQTIIILIACMFCFVGCKEKEQAQPEVIHDTIYVYYNDTLPKTNDYRTTYSNFTETRKVTFNSINDYQKGKVFITWYLWMDGDIVHNNGGDYISPKDIAKYKAKIMRIENDKIPYYLKLKTDFNK